MSLLKRCSTGIAAAALLAVGVGCNFNDDFSEASDYKLDKSSLDMYMGDAAPLQPASFETPVNEQPTENKGIFGRWSANLDLSGEMAKEKASRPKPKNEEERMAQEMADAFAQAMGAMMSFELTINEDHTFVLTMMGMPIEGPWTQNGDRLTLTPEKVMGMSPEDFEKKEGTKVNIKDKEPLELQILPNGAGLKAIDPKGELGGQELVFKRSK